MRSAAYWARRFEYVESLTHRRSVQAIRESERAVASALADIERDIARWYQRFADNNQIDLVEARRLLNAGELAEFKWSVQDYIRFGEENALNGKWMRQLENASARVHISRLEALKIQTQNSVERLFGGQHEAVDKLLREQLMSRYNRDMFELQRGLNVGFDVAGINDSTLERVMAKPWASDGRHFSDRIWSNKEKLVNELHQQLTQDILLGRGINNSIAEIARKMNTTRYNAERLIRTESAYVASEADKIAYREIGVEQFQILATLDLRTSDICQELDGKIFSMSEWQIGVTVPPFHVNCRTTTVPYDADWEEATGGNRAARDTETGQTYFVPSDMTYDAWKKKYVDFPRETEYNIFRDQIHARINGGEFPLHINVMHNGKHVPGSANFDPTRGTLTANIEELIALHAGHGEPIQTAGGKWGMRERFTHHDTIGIWRDQNGNEAPTTIGIIHYTKRRGVHIIPARPGRR